MRSAAYRIAFLYSAGFALATAILGIVVFAAMHLAFTRQLDSELADESAALVSEYRSDGESELVDAIAQRMSGPRDRLLYGIFARDGRRLHGSLATSAPPLGLHDIGFVDPREGPDWARALTTDLGNGERLVVAADRDRIEQTDHIVLSVFAIGFLAVIAFGTAGGFLLGGYLRRRLGAISAAAEAIVAGDMRRRMPVGARGDEFDRLARSLNAMLDRIDGLIENLRQVSSDVAHDLRTPLARLRNHLEAGLGPGADPPAVIGDALGRVDEILALFGAILRIAEVESGGIRAIFAPVDLSALVADLAESYAPAIVDAGRTLEWSIEPGISILGDRELLAQTVINLLENAQHHTEKGTPIELTLQRFEGGIRLAVADRGPGVAEADRARIVKRFARLDRSRSTPGHGLGLNLVAAGARLHHARLVFADNDPGLVARLEFPRADPP